MGAGVLGLFGHFSGGLVNACLNGVSGLSRALLYGVRRLGGTFLYGRAGFLGACLGGLLGIMAGGFQILANLGVERNAKGACKQRN